MSVTAADVNNDGFLDVYVANDAMENYYFEATGMHIVRGRGFTDRDRTGAPAVAVVNEAFVRKFLTGEPIGSRFDTGSGNFEIEVVGVVADTRLDGPRRSIPPMAYLPMLQQPDEALRMLYVRVTGDPAALQTAVRRAIAAADPNLAVREVVTLRELTERDANEIVAVLYSSSMEATKVADPKGKSFSVEVLSADLPRAVAVLRVLGLPRSPRTNLNEVFRATGFAPTPFEERVRFLFGQAQELERTISLMEGVLQTRVHVITPDNASRRADLEHSKASVYVSYDDRYDIEGLVPRIRKLISDSVEGLAPARVEILAIPSRVDLKVVSEVPIKRVLGIRVHKSDSTLFLIGISLVLGLLVVSVGLQVRAMRKSRASGTSNVQAGRDAAGRAVEGEQPVPQGR